MFKLTIFAIADCRLRAAADAVVAAAQVVTSVPSTGSAGLHGEERPVPMTRPTATSGPALKLHVQSVCERNTTFFYDHRLNFLWFQTKISLLGIFRYLLTTHDAYLEYSFGDLIKGTTAILRRVIN